MATDVAGYLDTADGKPVNRYVVLWSQPADAEANHFLMAGMSEQELQDQQKSLAEQRVVAINTLQVFRGSEGSRQNAGIWSSSGAAATVVASFDGSERWDQPQWDVSLAEADVPPDSLDGEAEPRLFAGLWRFDTQFESRLLSGLSPQKQVERARVLVAQGYRPVSVASLSRPSGPPLSALVWHRPVLPEDDTEQLARRQANASAGLLGLNEHTGQIGKLLRHRSDPRLRSYLLNRLAACRVSARVLLSLFNAETDASAKRAILLGLGELARAELVSGVDGQSLVRRLREIYRESPDPGTHSAAGWTLKQLGHAGELETVDAYLATGGPPEDRQWYVTKEQRHTLAILKPDEPFLMSSPITELDRFGGPRGLNEIRHRRLIPRSFAIGVKEVTIAQFTEFQEDLRRFMRQYVPQENADDAPAHTVTWYQAAQYCNWLSEKEKIPRDQWCYDPEQPFESGMTLYEDYLDRTGYRLPSEAEWEYACRAGATTARFFGEHPALLEQYAWYTENSGDARTAVVGTFKPNDFGLFDVFGNVSEWCQDPALLFPGDQGVVRDDEHLRPLGKGTRVLRGGSFATVAENTRAAFRLNVAPNNRIPYNGFRIARTYRSTE